MIGLPPIRSGSEYYGTDYMGSNIIVWDLETVPDLGGFAAANDLVGKSDVEVREAIGDKFPKHIYHSIVCIGALIAHREPDHLPVLRYRAMIHGVSAPGLSGRPYFHRYTDDAIDLCDALSSFSSQSKATLHEISRVMGLPGKPKGFDGGEVERYFREGKIKEIADYCETDVVGTYQVWLRYELFRGTLSQDAFEASERKLADFMNVRTGKFTLNAE